ncbi:MAG: elongation factor P [Dehalococcoidales bacterium]|jgi:elongation factor P|nr:elongation factor P [Dehalococcoidales bacterium]
MIGGTELRKGVVIELNDKLYQVVEYQHVKMKRTALAKVKLRDIIGGHTIEQSFQSGDKFVRARLDYRPVEYIYKDGELYYFMDKETFEQIPLGADLLGDSVYYLKEGITLEMGSYKEKFISIELPITVELKVTHAEPGFRGDTANAGTKPAKLETGLDILVPLFINEDDVIRVDTRTGSYLERVNN